MSERFGSACAALESEHASYGVPRKHVPNTHLASWIAFVVLLLVGAGVILLCGCAATPEGKWAQARSAVTHMEEVVIRENQAGRVSDEIVIDLVAPIIVAAREALTKAAVFLPEGGPDFDGYMAVVDAILASLERTLTPTPPARSQPP